MLGKIFKRRERSILEEVKVKTSDNDNNTVLKISIDPKSGEYMIEFGGKRKDTMGIVPIIDIIREMIYDDATNLIYPENSPERDTGYMG
jgi:hypothetical protein